MVEFEHWDSSYVIVGAAAGALIGLSLLFIGVHNSWDSVVFVSTGQHKKKQ